MIEFDNYLYEDGDDFENNPFLESWQKEEIRKYIKDKNEFLVSTTKSTKYQEDNLPFKFKFYGK